MARLLVVDDQRDICDVIGAYLTQEGHEVAIACNGSEARRAVEDGKFDVVILDMLLPGARGTDLAEVAQARGIPVILISGDPTSLERRDGHCTYPVLGKPFRLAELGSALRELLPETVRTAVLIDTM